VAALRALWSTRAGRTALSFVGGLAALTALGLVALWPRDAPAPRLPAVPENLRGADVLGVTSEGCAADASPGCRILRVRVEGRETTAELIGDAFSPPVNPGDRVRVAPSPTGVASEPFVFVDFDRRAPIVWLAVAFAVVILLLARRRGLFALLGLAASGVVLVAFVVPAILDGRPPLLVALVGASAVLLVTLALAHGPGVTSVAAALGAAVTLTLTALLALLLVEVAQLSGFVSEQALLLRGLGGGALSPQGLLLAGIVIAALGVLDDVAVSQAATVLALQRAAPDRPARAQYAEAITVGRDHLAATVNTLALAYAGAALPVLLAFSSTGTSLLEAVNREIVAQEVVALLVGSIGIACAVPLTTAVAVVLARRLPRELLAGAGHGHAH